MCWFLDKGLCCSRKDDLDMMFVFVDFWFLILCEVEICCFVCVCYGICGMFWLYCVVLGLDLLCVLVNVMLLLVFLLIKLIVVIFGWCGVWCVLVWLVVW